MKFRKDKDVLKFIGIFAKNYLKLKNGDYEEILIDERMELNMLRASKKGFLFIREGGR